MRRKLMLAAPVVVFVLIAVCFSLQPSREIQTVKQFEADRAVLTQLAQQVLEQESASEFEVSSPWQSVELYNSGVLTVEFSIGGSGMGSETTYWGVNFVPNDGYMVGFQGQRWDYWKQDGDGRLYYEPEGDNTCYVKKLDECWYYYEMSF